MVQTEGRPGTRFKEGFVEAEGLRIRYLEAGQGSPVIQLHGAGGLSIRRADMLAEQHRVIAFEVPGFGQSTNEKSQSMYDLAGTMARAAQNLGLDRYNLMGTSFGGRLALCQALEVPDAIEALVLAAPNAVLPEGFRAPTDPEQRARAMFAHPERLAPAPPPDPAVVAKQDAFIERVGGRRRDRELEARLPEVEAPTLVLFGTLDGIVPPEVGRVYREKIPNCNLVLVYDAAHAIAADRPEAFVGAVSDFLERHEVFIVSRRDTLINP